MAIPDDVPFEVVAPFGCGVQTGVGGVMNILRPLPNSSIAILAAPAAWASRPSWPP